MIGHFEREQSYLEDLRSPWLLTTYVRHGARSSKWWEDDPNRFWTDCSPYDGVFSSQVTPLMLSKLYMSIFDQVSGTGFGTWPGKLGRWGCPTREKSVYTSKNQRKNLLLMCWCRVWNLLSKWCPHKAQLIDLVHPVFINLGCQRGALPIYV